MRVVMFFPRVENSYRTSQAPLGILSIATYLNANGHDAVICDRFFCKDSVENIIKEHNADIIGVSVISHQFIKDAIEISKEAKKAGVPVVWGGSLTTPAFEVVIASDYVDYVSLNEGEETWLEMADAFDKGSDFENIAGLAYKKDGKVVRTADRDFVDLSKLPTIDWSLVDVNNYFQKSYGYEKQLVTYLSKGCTGRCTYCYNPIFNRSTRRIRPLEQVVDEMCGLVRDYGADGFDFSDDTMFNNRDDVVNFCNSILAREEKFCWSGYLSFGVVNDLEGYELMYKAGCRSMIYGVESGSPRVLKSVRKRNRLDNVLSNVELCVKAGIVPILMFIIGFPGETLEDIRETVELVKKVKGGAVVFNYFTPLPGTMVYNQLVEEGKLTPPNTLEEMSRTNALEGLFDNYSEVPTKDLIIIKKFMRLRGMVTPVGDTKSEQLSMVIKSTLQSWSRRGFLQFVSTATKAVTNILSTFTVFLHPKIRKKYGLYFTK